MLEILQYIFSGFFTWLGFTVTAISILFALSVAIDSIRGKN